MVQVMLERMVVTLHLEHFSQLMVAAAAVSAALLAVMVAAFYPLPTLQQLLDSHCLQRLVKR
jgi:hypothetical protein